MSSDALLGLLAPGWQVLVAIAFAAITVVGLFRLAQRGQSRMTHGVFVTGALIVSITVLGTLAVSCAGPADRGTTGGQR